VSFTAELDTAGRRVVVCGAGAAALGTIRTLVESRAQLTVVGTEVATSVADLADRGLLTLVRRELIADDVIGAALVVPATGGEATDARVAALAREHGALASVARPTAERPTRSRTGLVLLVGGGPGDPGLLTVAGLAAIRRADVIVCDRLAPLAALDHARPDAVIIDVAKIPRGRSTPQERINELLVEHAQAGRTVVRLKGGDGFVFGRGGEEWQACAAAGVPVTVLPGVSSAIAGPALAGVPLTHRQLTQGFTVVSGHVPPGDPASTLDWAALARTNTTLVVMMGVATLPAVTAELIHQGLPPDTAAMTVADAGMPSQRSVRGTVADIAARSREAGLRSPAITVIGRVAGFSPT
jgi:uroporphyrin-III C-methyltransferase